MLSIKRVAVALFDALLSSTVTVSCFVALFPSKALRCPVQLIYCRLPSTFSYTSVLPYGDLNCFPKDL